MDSVAEDSPVIPDALLTDGVIELRLLRVLEIGDMTRRDGASAG